MLKELPDTKKYLIEILRLLQSPRKEVLFKSLTSCSNLVPLLNTCANETGLGRKILSDLARANPNLLKLFVDHGLLVDSNPDIRLSCLYTIYDLINETNCEYEYGRNSLNRPSCENVSSIRLPGQDAKERKKLPNLELTFNIESKSGSITFKSCSEMKSSSLIPEEPPIPEDPQTHRNRHTSIAKDRTLPSGNSDMIHEDVAPDLNKSRGSASWFIDPNKGALKSPRLGLGSSQLTLDDSDSDTEEANPLSPEEKLEQEKKWFESIRGTGHSFSSEPRPSILKTSSSFRSKKSESVLPLQIPNSPENAFMWKLSEFGILTSLSDLATLDPFPKCREIAEQTLELLLQRAPSSLLTYLPTKFGQYSRIYRQLRLRPASRPIILLRKTKIKLKEIYGGLAGRTLLLDGASCVFAEQLMSYFHGYCQQNALQLIVSLQDDPIIHVARYPGFADLHHKLSQCSNVNFQEEREYKVFNPGDLPKALRPAVKTRGTNFMNQQVLFGIDPAKVGSNENLKGSKFNNIIWNFPGCNDQVNTNVFRLPPRDLVSSFFNSAIEILDPKGSIQIALYEEDDAAAQYEMWDLEEVAEKASLGVVTAIEAPRFLSGTYEYPEHNSTGSKATVYVLKFLDAIALDPSDDDTYSDTYSEPSSDCE